jgi:hypothetical protein
MDGRISLPRENNHQLPNQFDHPWLADLIFALDRWLQRRNAVFEFTSDPRCVFRIQFGTAEREVVLSDGTMVRASDRVINLHFWNEHIPSVPERGASIAWARHMYHDTAYSLRQLAQYLAESRDLDDVVGLQANMCWGTAEQTNQLARITRRLGFDVFPRTEPIESSERLHRLGENIYVSLMVLAQNTAALRRDSLWRDRTEIFLSRRTLDRRYGDALNGA